MRPVAAEQEPIEDGAAVVSGRGISWAITKRQIESAQRIARIQLVAPMRQAWINALRKLLAELLSSARHYYAAGFEDRSDNEYRRLTELEEEIVLMINPIEQEHRALLDSIRAMVSALGGGKQHDQQFLDAHRQATDLAQKNFEDRMEQGQDR